MCVAMALWVIVEATGSQISRGYSPYQIVWTRYATHILLLALLLGPRRLHRMARTELLGAQVARGLLMVGMPASFITALHFASARDVWAMFWVAPLMVVGLSIPVLGEKPGLQRWLATVLGLAGALLIVRPSTDLLDRWGLLPLGMAACFALYVVLTRSLRGETVESRLFYTALVPFLCLSPVMLFLGRLPTPRALLFMLLVGAVGLVTLWAIDKALDLAPASFLAPFVFTQLLWAVGLEGPAGATLGRRAAAGALVVLASGAWALLAEHRRSEKG